MQIIKSKEGTGAQSMSRSQRVSRIVAEIAPILKRTSHLIFRICMHMTITTDQVLNNEFSFFKDAFSKMQALSRTSGLDTP